MVSVAEWAKRLLVDDFQKSRKNAIFENCIKNLSFEKYQMFDFFKVARPVCSRLHFDLRKHFT